MRKSLVQIGDMILLTDKSFEVLPAPLTRAEAEQRIKPFKVIGMEPVEVNDGIVYDLELEGLPYIGINDDEVIKL